MRPQTRSIHNRSYSFSNWDSIDHNSQQARHYYDYAPKNQYRDMPSFGEKFTYKKNQDSIDRSRERGRGNADDNVYKSTRENEVQKAKYSVEEQVNQNKFYHKKTNDYMNRMKTQENWYSRNPSRQYENVDSRLSNNRGSRIDYSRATEQKLSNIDKINSKIRKILDTLNEEQKKISQNHLKIGSKKISAHSHSNSYANRIKTQGDNDLGENYKGKQKQKDPYVDNLYGKLVGIRERYQPKKQILGQINVNNMQWERKYQPQRKLYLNQMIQSSQGFHQRKESKCISTLNQDNIHKDKDLQNKKYGVETPYKLLKKSTDSLSMSSSIYLKNEKQQIGYFKDNHANAFQNNKLFLGKNDKYSNNYYLQRSYIGRNENANQNKKSVTYFQEKSMQNVKTQPNFYKPLQRYQSEQDGFSSFGQSRTRHIENTPKRSYVQRSMSKYEKSQKSCKLSNGKDLDAEIEKIQRKINDFESIKKELGVSDETKNSRNNLNRSISKYRQTKSPRSSQVQQRFQKLNSKSQDKYIPNVTLGQKNSQQIPEFHTFSNPNITLNFQQSSMASSKMNQEEVNNDIEVSLPKPFKMSSKRNTKRIGNSNIKQIESRFVSEERFIRSNSAIRSLIENLCKQIQLDSNLRSSKKWFHRKDSPYKWVQLSKQLARRNIKTSEQQNKQIFTMAQEQENPFYTARDEQGSYGNLIQNFLTSQKFWIENLQHKYIRSEIESIKQMDIDKKGCVKIQDMVRYINLQSDKYYRNRDLSLVFRRLSGTQGEVTMQYILAEFCQ